MFVIAKLLIVNEEGRVLAIRRSGTDERRPLQWDFPGGFVEPGEDVSAAIIREAKEEAGITVSKPMLAFGMSELTSEGHGTGTWLTFMVRVTGTPAVRLSFEHDQYQWMSIDELLEAVQYDRQLKMLGFVKDNNLLQATLESI